MKKILLLLAFLAFSANGFAQATAYEVDEVSQCMNEVFDLAALSPTILGNQDPDEFTVTFFTTEANATTNTAAIANPNTYIINGWQQTIWVRVQNNANGDFDVDDFVISMSQGVTVPDLDDVVTCGNYILPYIQWPALYYTEPNMGGQQLASGTVITTSQTIYIYAISGVCNAESSFTVTITGEGPYIMPPNPLIQCDANGDGIEVFNIEALLDGIAEIQGVESATLYETQTDAENDTNGIPSPDAYTNIAGEIHTVYIRVVTSTGCVNILPLQLITFECPTNNVISGHVTYDEDGNGCTENDPPAAGIWVYYNHDNFVYYAYTDANGYYNFTNVPDGVSFVYVATAANEYGVSPASATVNFPGENPTIDFCLSAPVPFQDVAVYLWPQNAAVPGFVANYIMVIQNLGTETISGTVATQFDASNLTYIPSADFTLSGNTLTLTYTDLAPFETRYYYFSATTAQPPALNLGDVLTFTTVINPVSGDAFPDNNTFVLDQVVMNSFDPNDITCREGEFITEAQADGYLHYMVRFQNTGNFPATNINVQSILDSNLDWDTFEPIGASHNYQAYREGASVRFDFNGINLPGTDNEPASHGYVMYKIKPKATVQIGDSMSAQAGIYFDFNTAVITNNYTTTIVTMGTEAVAEESFAVYPNPASGTVNIKLNGAESANVSIADVLGKTVLKAQVSSEGSLDISALNSGVYFVTVQAGGAQSTQKLVVK